MQGAVAMLVDDIIITDQLTLRAVRAPNHVAECGLFLSLSGQLNKKPMALLKRLVCDTKKLCDAGTAGLSELARNERGEEVFRWSAIAGAYAPFAGGSTPRDFSPCGTCLDRGSAQLYDRPQRVFTYFKKVKPAIVEGLVIPIIHGDQPLGTIWIVSHDARRRFDKEDVRIMTNIAGFAGALLHQGKIHQACQKNELFSQAILSASPDCIKVLDSTGKIVYLNEPGKKLMGIGKDRDVLNQRWLGFWTGEGRARAARALQYAQNGTPSQFQGFRPTFRGEPKWWHVTITLLPGEGRQVLVISRDITALKDTEEALRKSQNALESRAFDLESLVAARTSDLKKANEHLLLVSRQMLHAEEKERRRIAKELHDEFGQHLTGLKLLLESLEIGRPFKESTAFGRAQRIIATLMQQVRDFSFDLRKSLPEHISLFTALAWHFQKLHEEQGLKVTLRCSQKTLAKSVPPELTRTVLRVVQESLTNVIRYAMTNTAIVDIAVKRERLRISIIDRGNGFDPDSCPSSGAGLAGMRERILLQGGTFMVESKPGDGTQVVVELPLMANT